MKVAAIQFNAGSNKEENVLKAVAFVRVAVDHGAEFICLPEVFNYRGQVSAVRLAEEISEPVPGPSTLPFAEIAQKKQVFILAGSVFERSPHKKKAFNTTIVFGPKGETLGTYRKQHLFEALVDGRMIREEKNFIPGAESFSFEAKSFKIGVSICYDIRFSEIYTEYRQQGCQVFAIPSAFTQRTGRAHWEVLARARAIENLAYVIGPNQVGTDERGIAAYGRSLIISPWGEVLARASDDKEEIIYADMELKQVRQARKNLPSLFKGR